MSNIILSVVACHILAEFYMTVENDVAKAMELYENNCKELNVYDSCLALGNIFLTSKSKEPVRVPYCVEVWWPHGSVLNYGKSNPGLSPGCGHCVLFLGNTPYSHSVSLHPCV